MSSKKHPPACTSLCLGPWGCMKLWTGGHWLSSSCCGPGPAVALLRASLVHVLCSLPFPEEKTKAKQDLSDKAKQDLSDVLKVRLWFSDQLRKQTCCASHYSCFFQVNAHGFIQRIFISGFLFHDISSISWLTVFIIVKFDYRIRQNCRARHVSTMQFHSKLAPFQPEDCMERGSILSLPSDVITKNTLILFGSHQEHFIYLK